MLYGFPLSINDDDCDIGLLNPYPSRSRDPSWNCDALRSQGQASLLSYKHSMVELSIIIKSALTNLYGLRRLSRHRDPSTDNNGSRLQNMMSTVASLEARIQEWYQNLPEQMKFSNSIATGTTHGGTFANNNDAAFQSHLFQLQALALKLAFENSRILIHRPLLSYNTVSRYSTLGEHTSRPHSQALDLCQSSISTCRNAALEISRVGSTPTFRRVADTYAVSFVSLHLFTAAVALSIMTSLEPLSQSAHESKLGTRRIMEMQSLLRTRSIIAEQGLAISKKLVSLVLTKEMEKILKFPEDVAEAESNPGAVHFLGETTNGTRCMSESQGADPTTAASDHDPDELSIATGRIAEHIAESNPPATVSAVLDLSFGLCEDPMIAQALLDFEEGNFILPLAYFHRRLLIKVLAVINLPS